ncbi:hypothetical protein KP509_15G051300 [Ceratopteris richardii]|uniref:FAD-binding FR-type domain-containing protein n=1 Tax=Ceratopteris richardii TaxID=49495 RepID=A0A8T2T384_CERRI|nr:hypothetical protein KP509_15G051300 [Ceratopteris richardii]
MPDVHGDHVVNQQTTVREMSEDMVSQGRQLLLLRLAKHALISIILSASLLWVSWWLVSSEPIKDPKYLDRIEGGKLSRFLRVDGKYGLIIMYQAMPVLVIAILSLGVVELRKKIGRFLDCDNQRKMKMGNVNPSEEVVRPTFSTYPLLARLGWWNPFGVLTVAEVLMIVGILLLVLYSFGRLVHLDFKTIEERYRADPVGQTLRAPILRKLDTAAEHLGRAAIIPFALLWIPVSRGSPILRLLNIPFEHAVKYHIWLATFTLVLLTGHSVSYIIYYCRLDTAYKIFDWVTERERCSLVAGFIAWISGLLMWSTSLSYFRRRWYEMFFGIHHLYIVFFLFWMYHAFWTIHFFILPILLFVIDRLLRMVQSRRSVDVLSAKVLKSGAIQLYFPIDPQEIQAYHALSSWYLRFPSLSRTMKLQWHFFSVTSAPSDETMQLSIIIKPLGKWTCALQRRLLMAAGGRSNQPRKCPFSFKAGVEGPYGDETDFYVRYNTVVLIGGGIGVTPLLAILSDVLHRTRATQMNASQTRSIHLYHCIRKVEELCVLNSVNPNDICPEYEKLGLRICVSVYVTNSSSTTGCKDREIDLKTANYLSAKNDRNETERTEDENCISAVTIHANRSVNSPVETISTVGPKGKSSWVAATMLASIAGFYISWGLSNVYIVKNIRNNFPTNYNRAHIVIGCIIFGTFLLGGPVVMLWWLMGKRLSVSSPSPNLRKVNIATASPLETQAQEYYCATETDIDQESSEQQCLPWNGKLHIGDRPVWSDIFDSLEKEYNGQNIGVLVSGSESMQADVASECQKHTKVLGASSLSNVFHYHSVSFEL